MDNKKMLDVLSHALHLLPGLMAVRELWSSLIVNRRKPWTYRAFTSFPHDGENFRICLHRFATCDEMESFLHPHPWPGAFIILQGQYLMNLGQSADRISKPTDVARILLGPGSSYAITNPLTWHSVTPIEECFTVMVNGTPWDTQTVAHTEVRTTKGKDLDSMTSEDLDAHFEIFRRLWSEYFHRREALNG